MDIRALLAKRLKAEIARREIKKATLAESAHVPESIVSEMLQGTRKLSLDELFPVCQAMEVDPMWLMSPEYKPTHLSYRNVSQETRKAAAKAERAFTLLFDSLPKAKRPPIARLSELATERCMIFAELLPIINGLRERYQTISIMYKECCVFAFGSPSVEFDAFLLSCDGRIASCVNKNHPEPRIAFSLLHEFAHFLFHADRDTSIDTCITGSDLYKTPSLEALPEFVANKFAQLWLVPFDIADNLAANWPDSSSEASDLAYALGTSKEVVANMIYDCLMMRNVHVSYKDVKERICTNRKGVEKANSASLGVYDLIEEQLHEVTKFAKQALSDCAPSKRRLIKDSLGV